MGNSISHMMGRISGCPGERLFKAALPDGDPSKLASRATKAF
jgi:hypothetical protein